jgi:DNA-directed RNA polymerase beta' subunit
VDKDVLRRKSHGKWDTLSPDERWLLVTHSKRASLCPHHCTDIYNIPQPQYSVEKIRVIIQWDALNDWIAKQVSAKEENAEQSVLEGPFCPCTRCGEHRRVTRNPDPGCDCELCCKHRENAIKTIESAKILADKEFTAADAKVIMSEMHEEDLEFMGIRVDPVTGSGHPRDMILEKLPVEPRPLRPPSAHDKGRSRSQNDKTHKYQEIMKAVVMIREQILQATNGAIDRITASNIFSLPSVLRQHLNSADLQTYEWQIATLFHNEIKNVKVDRQRSGKPFKSLHQQFKGKHGWWRQHAVAKRCDQSARSVVTPCNALDIDELGVPMSICLTNTKPVIVTSFNIGELTEAVRLGPGVLGGASHVKDLDGEEIDLQHCQHRERIELRIGMNVDRYLKKGDIVLFNRQPTLHRPSVMAHKVVPMEGSTFRLNLTVTTPYNAG